MTPTAFSEIILMPGLALLHQATGVPVIIPAPLLLLAIAGQESGLVSRRQEPSHVARGFWQFERAGGVRGVLNNPISAHFAAKVCAILAVPADEATVYEALAWSDHLAVAFARLLLWTDHAPLPTNAKDGWAAYQRLWRPGTPRPDAWAENYAAAEAVV